MAVDEGIDVFATRKNKLYAIQVKTVREYPGKRFPFLIRVSSLARRSTQNTFYFLVVPSDGHFDFVVLPLRWIRWQIGRKKLRKDEKTKSYVMRVVRREGMLYLNNKKHSLAKYTNNWSLLN